MRKFISYIVLPLGIVLGAAYLLLPSYSVEITKDQIQSELTKHLPYQVDKLIGTVIVQEAVVRLDDSNKLAITAAFEARGLTLEGQGSADVFSSLRYEKGKFYLDDLRREDVSFVFSENSQDTITEMRGALTNLLRRETDEATASGDESRIARMTDANEYVANELRGDALDALDNLLNTFPIYDLYRVDGVAWIAALALDDVQISADVVRVTLSLQTILARLFGFLGLITILVVARFGLSGDRENGPPRSLSS